MSQSMGYPAGYPTEWSAEATDIQRRQKLAEALRTQSMGPIQFDPRGKLSWTQGLNKVAQAFTAGMGEQDATTRQQTLVDAMRTERTGTLDRAIAAARGTPTQNPMSASEPLPGEPQQVPAVAGNPMAGMQILAGSNDPMQAQFGQKALMEQFEPKKPVVLGRTLVHPETGATIATDLTWQQEQDATRQAREAEATARREERKAELEAKLADARISREERAAAQRELVQMQIQGRKEMLQVAASLRAPHQEPQPQIVQTENGPMVMDRAGNAKPVVGPDGQPVKAKGTERALPTTAAAKLMENQQNLRRADQVVALLEGRDVGEAKGDKDATGKKGLLTHAGVIGDKTLNWLDPSGVDTRAAVGDLGSLVVHDRSGAAVTASEFPRLRPFIPLATDSPEVALKKAKRFATEYRAVVEEAVDFYQGSGYKVPSSALRPAGAAPGATGGWDGQERRQAPANAAPVQKFDAQGSRVK